MLGAEDLLADFEYSLEQWLGAGNVPKGDARGRQFVEIVGDIQMIGSQLGFVDCKSAPQKLLGFFVLSLLVVSESLVPERFGQLWRVASGLRLLSL
jgi:hypothetical protein